MGVARRIAELYEVKMNAVLDRAEDPREMVDYSYAQLQELLAEVHRGAAEIAAGRRRAQMQVSGLQRSADQLQEQAEQAVAAGHEDLAGRRWPGARRSSPRLPICATSRPRCARKKPSYRPPRGGCRRRSRRSGSRRKRSKRPTPRHGQSASTRRRAGGPAHVRRPGRRRRGRRAAPSAARCDQYASCRRGGTGPDQGTAGAWCRAAGRPLRRGRPCRSRDAGPARGHANVILAVAGDRPYLITRGRPDDAS